MHTLAGMCERYVVPDQMLAEREFAPEQRWWRFEASFNVAPLRYVPAVRLHEGQSEAVMMCWGLIPAWAKGDASAGRWLRISSDKLQSSPLFRGPWLSGQRCILPCAGFYTWRLTPGGYRQPYFVQASERPVLAVAALWDRTEDDDGDVFEGCAILTVPASPSLGAIQTATREMPAILAPEDYGTWLRGTPVQARALLRTAPDTLLTSHAVSPRINSLACDDEELVRAVG
ncbi:MAG TPA: SOS response-associated peptidase [Steroidobacteraceae bacterium]|jgi:putative SOS response-associated peptidase YedK|nr:SOS response-associated peptidase [Steroidobacteraceae bacterium]